MICPLYKQSWIQVWGEDLFNLVLNDDFYKVYVNLIQCDCNNCALWVPSDIEPEKYGHCGLKK